MTLQDTQIEATHRIGQFQGGGNCQIVVRRDATLKTQALKKSKKLKDQKNELGKPIYINKQLPEQYIEANRVIWEQIKDAKDTASEEGLDEPMIEVKKQVVYVNKQPIKKFLHMPKGADLFIDKSEQKKIDKIKLYNSDTHTEKGSSFTAFGAKCSSITEVRRTYVKMKQLFPEASHGLAAYVIKNGSGYEDDREFGASSKMLKTLKAQGCTNTAIYIVHRYGGTPLGPKQHEMIEKRVLEAIARMK